MKHFHLIFQPDGKEISIHEGSTIIEAAGQAGIILNSVCGGKGTCKKCKVILEPESREVLACQYEIHSDLTITVPATSRFFEHKILSEGVDTKADIEADVYKRYLEIAAPGEIFGLAVDIGTTTVVAKLIDMAKATCIATQATLNPQARYGDDVISRINHAENEQKLNELREVIIDCINQLIAQLCKQASIETRQIFEMCVVGNTTMNHVFLNFPIHQLGQAPYKAFSVKAHNLLAGDLAVNINPAGNIHTAANIAGFVGADTTAVALAVDIDSTEQVTLVVDIGTNGEVILGTPENLCAASCAAGPALEGARIIHGGRAAVGAIEAVIVNEDDIDIDVIGEAPAHSICGSGLIDAVAVLLDLGIVDATGRFLDANTLKDKLPEKILSRITEHNGQPAFILADSHKTGGTKVILTQADIRQLQLAKGAIRTGIELLQRRIGLADDNIERVLLAGAFGNYIRAESALRIGLLPKVPVERIHFVGNAASSGAQMMLISQNCRDKASELAEKIEYVEIAHEPDFQTVFADSMLF